MFSKTSIETRSVKKFKFRIRYLNTGRFWDGKNGDRLAFLSVPKMLIFIHHTYIEIQNVDAGKLIF